MTNDSNNDQSCSSSDGISGQKGPNPPSKKGLIVGIVALIAVVVVAAIAYNALAPVASNDGKRIVSNSPVSSGSESSNDSFGSPGAQSSESGQSGEGGDSPSGEKTEAPDFTVTDADGDPVSLSQYRGKPIVLNFWASTCGPCRAEMPDFQDAFEDRGEDVQFMMVDVIGFNGETEKRGKEFVSESRFTFPVYFDTSEEATTEYGLSSIPKTFFIDSEGYLVAMASGSLDAQSLARGMDMILE